MLQAVRELLEPADGNARARLRAKVAQWQKRGAIPPKTAPSVWAAFSRKEDLADLTKLIQHELDHPVRRLALGEVFGSGWIPVHLSDSLVCLLQPRQANAEDTLAKLLRHDFNRLDFTLEIAVRLRDEARIAELLPKMLDASQTEPLAILAALRHQFNSGAKVDFSAYFERLRAMDLNADAQRQAAMLAVAVGMPTAGGEAQRDRLRELLRQAAAGLPPPADAAAIYVFARELGIIGEPAFARIVRSLSPRAQFVSNPIPRWGQSSNSLALRAIQLTGEQRIDVAVRNLAAYANLAGRMRLGVREYAAPGLEERFQQAFGDEAGQMTTQALALLQPDGSDARKLAFYGAAADLLGQMDQAKSAYLEVLPREPNPRQILARLFRTLATDEEFDALFWTLVKYSPHLDDNQRGRLNERWGRLENWDLADVNQVGEKLLSAPFFRSLDQFDPVPIDFQFPNQIERSSAFRTMVWKGQALKPKQRKALHDHIHANGPDTFGSHFFRWCIGGYDFEKGVKRYLARLKELPLSQQAPIAEMLARRLRFGWDAEMETWIQQA